MVKISNINFNRSSITTGKNISSDGDIKIFPEYKNNISTEIESDEQTASEKKAFRFLHILNNEELINDETFLAELEEIKNEKLSVFQILAKYRLASDGENLLDAIDKSKNIKFSTKLQYEKYFKEALYKECKFDPKYKRLNTKSQLSYKDFKHESDSYNVVQKNENILEIENIKTSEKRYIEFNDLLPSGINGLNNVVLLKSVIQKLPAEILFQIPEEVSLMFSQEALDATKLENEQDTELPEEQGALNYVNGQEFMCVSGDSETIIHEVAHSIFFNKGFNDSLEADEELVKIFNTAKAKYKKEHKYHKIDKYDPKNYWTSNISEMGAEIITGLYTNNTKILDSVNKYAPKAIPIVFKIFKQRFDAGDKHNYTGIYQFFDAMKDE